MRRTQVARARNTRSAFNQTRASRVAKLEDEVKKDVEDDEPDVVENQQVRIDDDDDDDDDEDSDEEESSNAPLKPLVDDSGSQSLATKKSVFGWAPPPSEDVVQTQKRQSRASFAKTNTFNKVASFHMVKRQVSTAAVWVDGEYRKTEANADEHIRFRLKRSEQKRAASVDDMEEVRASMILLPVDFGDSDEELEVGFSWVPAFENCSSDFLEFLEELAEQETVNPGDIIVDGDVGCADLIIIKDGSVEERLGSEILGVLGPGDYNTCLGILDLSSMTAGSLICVDENSILIRLTQDNLNEAFEKYPDDFAIVEEYKEDLQLSFESLSRVDLFNFFISSGDKFFWLMTERAQRKILEREECVVHQGDEGQEMYIIESGAAIAEFENPLSKGKQKGPRKKKHHFLGNIEIKDADTQMAQLGAGTVFGELGMMGITKQRSATIRVVTETAVVLELFQEDIEHVMTLFPKAHEAFQVHVQELAQANLQVLSKEVHLRQIRIFANCQLEFCTFLEKACEHRIIRPDTLILQEAAPGGDALFMVHQGKLDVSLLGKIVGEISENECFGEATMLGITQKNTASVRTRTLVSLLVLHRDSFHEALAKFPAERQYFESLVKSRNQQLATKGQQQHEFFANGDPHFIKKLQTTMFVEMFLPDQIIVAEGDVGTSMFILSTGRATASVRGVIVSEFEAGEVFGVLTLLGIASKRTATIVASSVCIVEVLHQHTLEEALIDFPEEQKRFEEIARKQLGYGCDYSIYSWPFFRDCPSRFLYLLDINLERHVYLNGQTIVSVSEEDALDETSQAYCMFVVLRGHADAIEDGNTYAHLTDGDVFGEMAVLGIANEPQRQLIARSMCDMHILNKLVIDHVFKEFPQENLRFQNRIALWLSQAQISSQDGEEYTYLKCVPIFQEASDPFLQYLYSKLETRLFMPGHDLVTEGESVEERCMYILRRGSAELLVHSQRLKTYGPGDYFGEVSMLGISRTRTATVRSLQPCVVQLLHQEDFMAGLELHPENKPTFEPWIKLAGGHLREYLRQQISQLELFVDSDSKFLEELAENLEERTYNKGDVVMHEKSPMTNQILLLVSGELSVEVNEVVTGYLQPGELGIFGDNQWLGVGGGARYATLRCISSCLIMVLHKATVERALAEFPEELAKFQAIDQERIQQEKEVLDEHKEWASSVSEQIISQASFFRSCSKQFIEELVWHLNEVVHPSNTVIAEDYTPADSLIFLLEGTAEVIVDGVCLGKLRDGAIFGDENVLGFPRRTATLCTRTICRTIFIRSQLLRNVHNVQHSNRTFLEETKLYRGEVARSLQSLPIFSKCDNVCLQHIALRAQPVGVARDSVWRPGQDIKYQGEAFAVLLKGQAILELEGFQVTVLTPGAIFDEAWVYQYHGVLRAKLQSAFASFRRFDVHAAVLHFPKAQAWFNQFLELHNGQANKFQKMLLSRKTRAGANKPHPRDEENRRWAASRGMTMAAKESLSGRSRSASQDGDCSPSRSTTCRARSSSPRRPEAGLWVMPSPPSPRDRSRKVKHKPAVGVGAAW